jgi:uncharacterized protein (DUF2237 family)
MNENFDPYREALVIETKTVWPEDLRGLAPGDRERIEAALHADAASATKLEYVRLHAGFCRQITVTPADLERLTQAASKSPS